MNDYSIMPGDVLHFSNRRRQNRITYRHWSYTVTRLTDAYIYFRFPGDERESREPWHKFNSTYRDSCDEVVRNGTKLIVWISDAPHHPVTSKEFNAA